MRFEGTTRHEMEEGDCLDLGTPADCVFKNESGAPCVYAVAVLSNAYRRQVSAPAVQGYCSIEPNRADFRSERHARNAADVGAGIAQPRAQLGLRARNERWEREFTESRQRSMPPCHERPARAAPWRDCRASGCGLEGLALHQEGVRIEHDAVAHGHAVVHEGGAADASSRCRS